MDKQTAKLIARISENLPPDMDENVMQGWIDNPKGLQQALREALCPPRFREKDGVILPHRHLGRHEGRRLDYLPWRKKSLEVRQGCPSVQRLPADHGRRVRNCHFEGPALQ